jgi:hypothetical protein
VTNEERERIRAAARRYVRDQGPIPPRAVLERVARTVLQARDPSRPIPMPAAGSRDQEKHEGRGDASCRRSWLGAGDWLTGCSSCPSQNPEPSIQT